MASGLDSESSISDAARHMAATFIRDAQQFQLGFLPTEQPHPRTRDLSETLAEDVAAGIDLILSVDDDILPTGATVLRSAAFGGLVDAMVASLSGGGRVVFSGCGATGRLSILLEAMWREFWQRWSGDIPAGVPSLDTIGDRVLSIMTGGDRALIRSEENFEDFESFGRQQVAEMGLEARDTLVAISEGGETSSVIGSAREAISRGARVGFVFNNPAGLLGERLERCRRLLEDPAVTVLDLTTGPMAVAGSTRMQATTCELLVLGTALERVLRRLLGDILPDALLARMGLAGGRDSMAQFADLLRDLRGERAIDAVATLVEVEQQTYEAGGRVTYFADDYLLDVLTDTTERAPTFTLPPFRPAGSGAEAPSWAFLKHPYLPTRAAWSHALRRGPRALAWTSDLYRRLGASAKTCMTPPRLDIDAIHAFQIGCEDDPSRYQAPRSVAMTVLVGEEAVAGASAAAAFDEGVARCARRFQRRVALTIGDAPRDLPVELCAHVPCRLPASPIRLWDHLAVKLVMNTLSTATMARMGRVRGNWMICAEATNKKLIDRSCRLVQAFTQADYRTACEAVHDVLLRRASLNMPLASPAVLAIDKLGGGRVDQRAASLAEAVPT